jgi:hypothetical protein
MPTTKHASPITLEDLKLTPAKEPMSRLYSGPLSYQGYWRQRAMCQLDAYLGLNLHKVFIVTEVNDNPGCSITNGIEMVADAIEEKFGLPHVFGPWSDRSCILVEHYDARSYSSHPDRDDYSIIGFKAENGGNYKYYGDPDWYGVEKSEIERLIGGSLA